MRIFFDAKPPSNSSPQISDDIVAEQCAEAISKLDFEGVAWLSALPSPDRIQLRVQLVYGCAKKHALEGSEELSLLSHLCLTENTAEEMHNKANFIRNGVNLAPPQERILHANWYSRCMIFMNAFQPWIPGVPSSCPLTRISFLQIINVLQSQRSFWCQF